MRGRKPIGLLIATSLTLLLAGCDQKQQPQQAQQATHQDKTQIEVEQQIGTLRDTVNELRGRLSVLEAQNLNARLGLLEQVKSTPAPAPVRTTPPASAPPKPQINVAEAKEAVAACVQSVHQAAPKDFNGNFYLNFDAYYDDGSGQVKNNAQLVGDQPPKFLFEKCLTAKGYSLH